MKEYDDALKFWDDFFNVDECDKESFMPENLVFKDDRIMAEIKKIAVQKQILDYGCGHGILSFMLLNDGAPSVTALEPSAKAIECVRKVSELRGDSDKLTLLNIIDAAILLGWGDENKDSSFEFISGKVSDGFSVATEINLASGSAIPLCIGVRDSKFVENLEAAIQFHVNDLANFAMNTLGFGVSYDLGGIKPKASFAINDNGDLGAGKWTKLWFGIDFTGFVDNTTFSLVYASGDLSNSGLGTINLTAKISF